MEETYDIIETEEKPKPLYGRDSISILLGAGFSAPMGYPIGDNINQRLLNFDDSAIDFAPDGSLATSTDGSKPVFDIDGVPNFYQNCFLFCKRLIKEFAKEHKKTFDYELFYDFIKSGKVRDERYRKLFNDLSLEQKIYEHYISNLPVI